MLLALIAFVVLASGIALAVLIPKDGYGTRQPPRSHLDSFPPQGPE